MGKMKYAIAGAVLLVALAVGGYAAFVHHGGGVDVSGVWHGQTTGVTYVIDKEDDNYRISVGGHRLAVTSANKDGLTGALDLNVRTDSGLVAVWSLKDMTGSDTTPKLHLDQDGFVNEDLQLQRGLTAVDRSRLQQQKPAKKPLWSPSFDCSKAGSDAERMVCTDPAIAQMDVKMAGLVHAAAGDSKALDAQKDWLRNTRDACTDINCVRNAYQQRISDLGAASMPAAEAAPEPAGDAAQSMAQS